MKRHLLIIGLFIIICAPMRAALRTPVQYERDIRSLFHAGDWDGGKALLNEADPAYGTLSVFCCLNGRYYYHMQDYDEARRYLILALRDDDANTEALELLVKIEREAKNYATAIAHINHLLEFSPYDPGWWRQKIELYRLQGNDIEANRLLERLYHIYPNDSTIRTAMIYETQMNSYAQHRAGNTLAEEESLLTILRIDPQNREARNAYNRLQRKRYNDIFARDRRNQELERREQDSLNVLRTARLSTTMVMQAMRDEERERAMDPDVLAAAKLREATDMIDELRYYDALALLDQVDTLATDSDLLAISYRRREACMELLRERDERRFIGDAIDTSYALIKRHQPAQAVPLLDSVLVLDPKHNEARQLEAIAHQKLHHYDTAYYYLASYHPLPEEVWLTRRQLHTLAFRSHHNDLNLEYQYARRSSRDEVTHNAYLTYAHSWTRDVLTVHADYAGRESSTETVLEEHTIMDVITSPGGSGVQLGAEYAHSFDRLPVPLTLTVQGSWANRYFPRWTAFVSLAEELPREWGLSEKLGWRRILNEDDNYHLLSLDLSASKALGQFILIPTFNAYCMLTPNAININYENYGTNENYETNTTNTKANFFFNGSLKMQYFPIEADRSNVFAAVGVGNAPESSLLDNSMPVQFANLNTFVSGGVYWVFTDNLAGSFATSWYTQENRKSDKTVTRNYIYINATIHISF